MTTLLLVAVLVSLQCISEASSIISCKDPDGNDVDWLYAYKLPMRFPPQHDDPGRRGLEFVYLTPHTNNWRLSPSTVDDSRSAFGRIMSQAYVWDSERLVLAYNDEPPGDGPADAHCGHTKGVLVADSHTAMWVVHSVPLYPDISANASTYSYPHTGHLYAQSFLCISTNSSQLNTIVEQLAVNEPHFYQKRIPPRLARRHPQLERLLHSNATIASRPPFCSLATVHSRIGHTAFTTFAKGRNFGRDLYVDWLAPTLDTDLLVETWRHGAELLPSNCTQRRRVWNVRAIRLAAVRFDFRTTGDHAKWAVAPQSDGANEIDGDDWVSGGRADWICVGDINRAATQMHRGGGTVCQQNAVVAQRYRELVDGFEPCEQRAFPAQP